MNSSEENRLDLPSESQTDVGEQKTTLTRWAAGVVLFLSTPMLLGSLGALLFFYLSPDRFNSLLNRLPGDQFIRSSLAFAPASLFAVVILATLYILEKPREPVEAPDLEPTQPGVAVLARTRQEELINWSFRLSMAIFLGSMFTLLLSFVAPGRFWDLVSFLPGQRYLRVLVQVTPILTFLSLLGIGVLRWRPRADDAVPARPIVSYSRITVSLVLTVAIPLFLSSVAALGLFYISPGRFETLLQRISEGSFLRLTLISAPALLLAVVLLASLYLLNRPFQTPAQVPPDTPSEGRGTLAVGVLMTGLLVSAALVLSLLGVIFVLLLR